MDSDGIPGPVSLPGRYAALVLPLRDERGNQVIHHGISKYHAASVHTDLSELSFRRQKLSCERVMAETGSRFCSARRTKPGKRVEPSQLRQEAARSEWPLPTSTTFPTVLLRRSHTET